MGGWVIKFFLKFFLVCVVERVDHFPKTHPNFGDLDATPHPIPNTFPMPLFYSSDSVDKVFSQEFSWQEYRDATGTHFVKVSASGKSVVLYDDHKRPMGCVSISKKLRGSDVLAQLQHLFVGVFTDSEEKGGACVFAREKHEDTRELVEA